MGNVKDEFVELLRSTERDGIEELVETLEEIGFFQAPASAKYHYNHENGLAEHSLNVCRVAMGIREQMIKEDPTLAPLLPEDSVILSTLLHDVCKADVYKKSSKKRKTSIGQWEEVEGYSVDYSGFPVGHGEKSVIVLLQYGFDLTDDEVLAIRWHMGPWELALHSPDARGNYNAAKAKSPLMTLVQVADGLASHLLERKFGNADGVYCF